MSSHTTQYAGNPRVSLIMPVWRPRTDWLEVAVAAALDQSGPSIELIVADDGNEVPVGELLAHVEDPRLRIERVPHVGVSAGRNAGVAAARGEYVRFIDCDDSIPRDSTARLYALMEGRGDRITYGASLMCDEQLNPRWRMSTRQQGDAVVDSLFASFNVRPGGGVMQPRSLLLRVPFDTSFTVAEDWDQMQRALEHATVRGTREVVHLYRRHPTSTTADIDAGRVAAERIVASYFERHPEQRGTKLERHTQAFLDAMTARVYATHHQPRAAIRHLLRGLRRDPLCIRHDMPMVRNALMGKLAVAVGRTP
jgi:glycosyltransferase involved in cell wall biosynthesis